MDKPGLIICGSIALDRIMNFSGKYADIIHSEKMHVLSLSVLLDTLEDTPGGSGANIAYNSALLGDRPILFDSVGQDASAYMQKLADAGVNTAFVHTSQLPTASFNVITDLDDNQVGGFYPGAMGDSGSLSLKQWAGQDVFVVIAAHDPKSMRSQVEECRQFKMRLLYDPGQQVSNVPGPDLMAGALAAEVLIANDYELGVLCKKSGLSEADLKARVPVVITTQGKQGSVIEGSQVKTPLKIIAAKPSQMVDPTGAGDALRAGFLYGYLRQWELAKCAQLGSTTASFVVEQHGTQARFSKQAVMQRYNKTFNKEIAL